MWRAGLRKGRILINNFTISLQSGVSIMSKVLKYLYVSFLFLVFICLVSQPLKASEPYFSVYLGGGLDTSDNSAILFIPAIYAYTDPIVNPTGLINTSADLEVRPYRIRVNWEVEFGKPDTSPIFGGKIHPSFKLYEVYNDGYRKPNALINVSGSDKSFDGHLIMPANSGIEIVAHQGTYAAIFSHSGKNQGYSMSYNISYSYDTTEPDIPSRPSVVGNNVVQKDDGTEYYVDGETVLLDWIVPDDRGNPPGKYWTDPSGVTYYQVRTRVNNGSWINLEWTKVTKESDKSETYLLLLKNYKTDDIVEVQIRVRDYEKNISEWGESVNLHVYREAPIFTESVKMDDVVVLNGQHYTKGKEITWNWQKAFAGPSGLDHYEVKIFKDGIESPIEKVEKEQFCVDVLNGHTYQIDIRAVDRLGRKSNWISSESIVVKRAVDKISVSNYPVKYTLESIDFKWNSVDDPILSNYDLVLTNNDSSPNKALHSTTIDPNKKTEYSFDKTYGDWNFDWDDSYYIWIRGIDKLGNTGEWVKTATFPTFTYSGPEDGGQYNYTKHKFIVERHPFNRIKGDSLCYRVSAIHDDIREPITSDVFSDGEEAELILDQDGEWEWYIDVFEYKGNEPIIDSQQQTQRHKLLVNTENSEISFNVKPRDDGAVIQGRSSTDKLQLTDIKIEKKGLSEIKNIYVMNILGDTIPSEIPTEGIVRYAPDMNEIDWDLLDEDGKQTILMWVEDESGNISEPFFNTIILDRIPPEDPSMFGHVSNEFRVQHGDEYVQTHIEFFWHGYQPTGADNNDELYDMERFMARFKSPDDKEWRILDLSLGDETIEINDERRYIKLIQKIDVGQLLFNQPVEIEVKAIDKIGNESNWVGYKAYTQGALAQITELDGGYSIDKDCHFLSWQLTDTGQAKNHVLEHGYLLPDGEFEVLKTIKMDNFGVLYHDELTARGDHGGTYTYRLVAINNSGDKTVGPTFIRTIPNTPPTAPKIISPLDFAGNTVTFSFEKSVDYDGDPIEYSVWIGQHGNYTKVMGEEQDGEIIYQKRGLKHQESYTWYVTSDDGYTKEPVRSDVGTFVVDTNKPELDVVLPIKQPYTNQSYLTVSVKDDLSGLDRIVYRYIEKSTNQEIDIDKIQLKGVLESQGVKIPLVEGEYHMLISVFDRADNEFSVEFKNLTVDHTSPTIKEAHIAELPTENGKHLSGSNHIPVSIAATDNLSGLSKIHYRFANEVETYEGIVAVSQNAQGATHYLQHGGNCGEYTLYLAMEDRAGNRSEYENLGTLIYDSRSPVIDFSIEGLLEFKDQYYAKGLLDIDVSAKTDSLILGSEYVLVHVESRKIIGAGQAWTELQDNFVSAGQTYQIEYHATNKFGIKVIEKSPQFIIDDSAPEVDVRGVTGVFVSGEQIMFNVAAVEEESFITSYRLAIGKKVDQTALTDMIEGNVNGWLESDTNQASTEFRVTIPEIEDGIYIPTIQVSNILGLGTEVVLDSFEVNNSLERVIAIDQGPYSMFDDRLSASLSYVGLTSVDGYRYRIIDQEGVGITDWLEVKKQEQFTEVTISDLQLDSGETYLFEAQVEYETGGYSSSGFSRGVTIDTSEPYINLLETPEYASSETFGFCWMGEDEESGITKVEVAVGSDYYLTDISKGWVEIVDNTVRLTRDSKGNPLKLIHGQRYYVTIRLTNGAGLITERVAPSVLIDNTPPPVPLVKDQGAFINDKQPLEAQWVFSPVDPESGNDVYEWALLTGEQLTSNNWESEAEWYIGEESKKIKCEGFQQVHGVTYYFAVKVTNGAGLFTIGLTDGILVDATAPYIPTVVLLDAANFGDPSADKELVYITTIDDLGLWIDSYDPESAIARYLWTHGGWDNIEGLEYKDESDYPIFRIYLEVEENGEIIVFVGASENEAELISPPGYSTGVILDTGAPVISNVRGSLSGGEFIFDWDSEPSLSPIAGYEVQLVKAGTNADSLAWIGTGLSRRVTLLIDDFSDGHYNLMVRAYNKAGTYSKELGVSQQVTLDTTPPDVNKLQIMSGSYASKELKVRIEATDELSGIGGYQYALGTRTQVDKFSDGWVDVASTLDYAEVTIDTEKVPHGSAVYVLARAKDRVGLWSKAFESEKVFIDQTAPTAPRIEVNPYATSSERITEISFVSEDPESDVTHFQISVVKEPGGDWLVSPESKEFDSTIKYHEINNLDLAEADIYYVVVKTRNGAGLWSDEGYSSPITVDTTIPTVEFIEEELIVNVEELPFSVDYLLSEASEVHFRLIGPSGNAEVDSFNGVKGTNQYVFDKVTYGTHTLMATPTDLAGNVGQAAVTKVRVNRPPVVKDMPAYIDITPGRTLCLQIQVDGDDVLPEFKDVHPEALVRTITVEDVDGHPVSYAWDCGDESADFQYGQVFQHKYDRLSGKDSYNLTLTITDNDGGITVKEMEIRVKNTTSGTLFTNEVWSGTHHIYGEIIVPSGIELTILPNSKVVVDGFNGHDYAMIIKGRLMAEQAEISCIRIMAGSWRGLLVQGEIELKKVIVRHAKRGLTIVDGADANIIDSIFEQNQVGVHAYGSCPRIVQTQFNNNTIYGIKEDKHAKPIIIECIFSGNAFDYYDQDSAVITVEQLNEKNNENSGNVTK